MITVKCSLFYIYMIICVAPDTKYCKLYCTKNFEMVRFHIMNRLATEKRTAVIAALVEGASINATCRMTGVAKQLHHLRQVGCPCTTSTRLFSFGV